MDSLIIRTDSAYERAKSHSTLLRRFTVFIKYGGETTEEIDVNATSWEDAKSIAEKALEMDYEPGGEIGEVMERPAGWWYM